MCLLDDISSASYLLQFYDDTKDMSTPSVYVHTDAPKTTEKMITSVLFFGRLLIS